MVSVEDIVDEDSLRAWLEALPSETPEDEAHVRGFGIALAVRSAARVLPRHWLWTVLSKNALNRDLTPLPLLRSLLISLVASLAPTDDIRGAAAAASAAAFHAAKAADADAAFHAAFHASAAAFHASAAASADAASAAAYAAIWKNVRQDCKAFRDGSDVWRHVLWDETAAPPSDAWMELLPLLKERSGDWDFWIEWYEKLRAGEMMPLDLLAKIALIDPEIWDEGPEVVNRMINLMWLDYQEFDDEVRFDNAETSRLTETPFQMLAKNARVVSMQLDTLIAFLAQQIDLLNGNNRVNDTEARDNRVLQLRAILEKVEEIADAFPCDEIPAANALEVIEENLPAVVEQADNLPAIVGEPEVSERITVLAASVKVLTDVGVSGDTAVKIVAAEMGTKSLGQTISNWMRKRKGQSD